VYEAPVGDRGQDVERTPAGPVAQRHELVVVIVVAKLEPRIAGDRAGSVQVVREGAPDGDVPDRAVGVDAEERVHDVVAAQRAGVGERRPPGGRIERLRDAEVTRGGADPVGVQQVSEGGRGEAGGAGGLHSGVADIGERGDRACRIGREHVAHGVELDADPIDRYAAAAGGCGVVGERGPRGRGYRARDADGRGHRGAGAQESATAEGPSQLSGVLALIPSGVHRAISFPARATADRDDVGAAVWRMHGDRR
jgi:hypothetical protein